MRRIRIVVHGARVQDRLLHLVVDQLREFDCEVRVRPTWEAGDAASLTMEALQSGVEMIVAAGGDGTVNEVLNGLMTVDATVPMAILPLGTANDFAGAAKLPHEAEKLAELIFRGEPLWVDVARVDDRYFLNAATGGFAAEATGAAPAMLKRAFGGLAYFLTGVAKLTSADEHRIIVDGPDFHWTGNYLGFAVTNARSAGGGHPICPEAVIDDGLLDVVVLPGHTSIFQATHMTADFKFEPTEEFVCRWRVPWVDVRLPEGTTLNVDGESRRIHRARFEVFPRRVAMVLPSDCPLIGGAISWPR